LGQGSTGAIVTPIPNDNSNIYDGVKDLLAELKYKLQCDAILMASKRSDDFPKLSASGAMANVQDEDWDALSRTPLSLAFESMKPVNVSNILMDQRFDLSKINQANVSQLCVPIASDVALSAINKSGTNSNKVISFTVYDVLIMRGYGKVIMQKLHAPEAKKVLQEPTERCSSDTAW